MGGPRCWYREGCYSEMMVLRPWQDTAEVEDFLDVEEQRLQCILVSGFWLTVPKSWQYLPEEIRAKREFYAGSASH